MKQRLSDKTFAAITALLLAACSASILFAQVMSPEELKILAEYEAEISSANPSAAKKFLEDLNLVDKVKILEPDRAAALVSKAQAVIDLETLLDKKWNKSHDHELSLALSIRIDFDKPLGSVGIGPEPETLLDWTDKYKKYGDAKNTLIKRGIRQFEVVFGTDTVDGKVEWEKLTIRERNTMLAEKADMALNTLIDKPSPTDKNFQDKVKNYELFKYLDSAGRARLEKYLKQMKTVESSKKSLSTPQIQQLDGLAIEQQMYVLGNIFDNSRIKGGAVIELRIDALRQSRPGETISYQNNQLLSGLLQTALAREIKGTKAGDRALKFYQSRGKLNVAIESCRGCYAKYEPSSNRIIFDSELIQQYMRVKEITAEDLVKNKNQLGLLAKYLSPMFVHEANHQMQHEWAAKRNVYKPYTQEDEIEANSMEALYTIEKLKNDAKFSALFTNMKKFSTYADKRLKLAKRFEKNPSLFPDAARQMYYYGIPSFESASSEILKAINEELKRRKSLSKEEQDRMESSGLGSADAMKMTIRELTGSANELKTSALMKIRDDLLHKELYAEHYRNSTDWSVDALNSISASRPSKSRVPVL
ncbi:MAG: hypothetical protein HY746_03940 [Elusimicrobia bacterium]|nr:hypothetical protein [Elusimicrobiota bacterium]